MVWPVGEKIRSASTRDYDALADLLEQVFSTDPLMTALAAPAPDPALALRHLLEVTLRDEYLVSDLRAPHAPTAVDVIADSTGALLGAALWNAPRRSTPPADLDGPGLQPASSRVASSRGPARRASSGAHAARTSRTGEGSAAAPAGINRAVMGGAWDLCLLDERLCEAVRPLEPHWHLYMLAVAPRAQGRGVGSRLLAHGLARADAAGLPAHLEATTAASKRLYERHGFRETAELGPCDPLPRYWALTRPAQAPASPSPASAGT